jgi:hypothetical protein
MPRPKEELFTERDLEAAVNDLETIPYFPKEGRATVMTHLRRMCPHKRALRWTVDTAVMKCRQWPGISELRGLLCTRFDAADGIDEPNCSIPGYSAEEAEARYIAEHEARKQLERAGPRREEAAQLVKQVAAGTGKGRLQ